MDRKTESIVREFLDEQYLKYNEKEDNWRGEIYADYRDEFDSRTLKEIFNDDHPQEAFDEKLFSGYDDCEWEYKSELIRDLKRNWDTVEVEWDEVEDEIREFIGENVYYDYPYDHYADQEVCVDIIVDTGDGNHDFVLNCVYPHYNGRNGDVMDDRASLLWLAKQFGYTKTQLNNARYDSEYGGSKFLESVDVEINNCSSHMNALTFFVKMTVRDCLALNERLNAVWKNEEKGTEYTPWKAKSKDHIIIPKGTACGLYDPWSGAGSVLEIEIEKDIKLPLKYVDSAKPDGCRGYGVGDVYGMMDRFWSNVKVV
jgi:hypothetical protein